MGEGAMKYSSRSDVLGILVLAGPLYYIYNGVERDRALKVGVFW